MPKSNKTLVRKIPVRLIWGPNFAYRIVIWPDGSKTACSSGNAPWNKGN